MTTHLRPRWQGLPLASLVAAVTSLACLCTVGVVAVGLAASGRLDPAVRPVLSVALVAGLMLGAGAAVGADSLASGLRELRADAVRRLRDPTAPVRGGRLALERISPHTSSEVLELARTLEALHARVRVADEVAERHRRTAESASAGMFELLSGLVAAEEGARGQLSAELHDSVAQSLMLARSLLSSAAPGPEEVERAGELVGEAEEQVRAVMARTRPPALQQGDLALAVATLAEDMLGRYGLRVLVHWPADPHPLPLFTAITVYRFFQEALLNVVKHADVDTATATLGIDTNQVWAVVVDDGPGFDPDQVRPHRGRHVGLGLLRDRARLAGGSLEVSSWPGDGTTLALRLPRGSTPPPPPAPAAAPPVEAAESA